MTATAGGPEIAGADQELAGAWQRLMELVLQQRFNWADVAGELGITQGALRALLALDPDRPPTMRELAAAMNCDPSYVTAVVDDLEGAKLASRTSSQHDRRVKTVVLTQRGIGALRTARDGLLGPPPQLERLDAAERRQLSRLLRKALA